MSGDQRDIAVWLRWAGEDYCNGKIDADEFERRVEAALRGRDPIPEAKGVDPYGMDGYVG